MAGMTFTIAGGPGVEVHVEEIAGGDLRFTVSLLGTGGLTGDLRGFFFQVADESLLGGLSLSGGGGAVTEFRAAANSVIDLGQGANMQGAARPFDIGVEIGTAGIGRDDWQSVTFVLSHATRDLSLDLIASQQFGVRMTSVGLEGGARPDGLKLVGTASDLPADNKPPVAVPDFAQTDEDTPVTIAVATNDYDPEGKPLAVSLDATTSALGAALILNPDGSITYDPTASAELGAMNAGEQKSDTFTYTVTDPGGATSSTTVTVTVGGVTDMVEDFLGKTLTYTYDYLPGTANSYQYVTTIVVGDGVEVPAMIDGGIYDVASLDVTANRLIIDYYQASFWESGGFNGFRLADTDGTVSEITGVKILSNNMAGFGADNISITDGGNVINVNWAGLSFTQDTRIVLDVLFA